MRNSNNEQVTDLYEINNDFNKYFSEISNKMLNNLQVNIIGHF